MSGDVEFDGSATGELTYRSETHPFDALDARVDNGALEDSECWTVTLLHREWLVQSLLLRLLGRRLTGLLACGLFYLASGLRLLRLLVRGGPLLPSQVFLGMCHLDRLLRRRDQLYGWVRVAPATLTT